MIDAGAAELKVTGSDWHPERGADPLNNPERRAAFHEAGHAVVASRLGVRVVYATIGDHPHVKTRPKDTPEVLRRLVLVDLSGPQAEVRATGVIMPRQWVADEANAQHRMLEILANKQGFELGEVDREHELQARRLIDELRPTAAQCVDRCWHQIQRVAVELERLETLSGEEIDYFIGKSRKPATS